jgi:hypothetical protein
LFVGPAVEGGGAHGKDVELPKTALMRGLGTFLVLRIRWRDGGSSQEERRRLRRLVEDKCSQLKAAQKALKDSQDRQAETRRRRSGCEVFLGVCVFSQCMQRSKLRAM